MNRERRLQIAAAATEEFTEAVRWYETRRPGLGAELYDAVNATIDGIERNLISEPPRTKTTRAAASW